MYKNCFKRVIDIVLSALGLLLLSWLYIIIIIAIKIDDPGPAFFSQKRVGKGKTHFMLHKFRSMKMCTPHDTPTHLLENPEQYITKVGKFLRKSSLDELPQIWDILVGNMSIIGPRPALWNQYDLIEERDKYGANDIRPGLTGWAQINGRDELEIDVKAKLDGEYVKKMSFLFDVKCFVGTIFSVIKSEGVVEGGTGRKKKLLVVTNHSYMLWCFRKELLQELQKEYDVVISTPFVGHEDDFEKLGFKMIETNVDRRGINPVTDLKLLYNYRRLIKHEQPDLVITYSIKPNIYAGIVCRLKRIPYCVNVQGLGTAFQKKGISEIATVLYRGALKKAKVVFFENEESARIFREKKITPKKQQKVLPGAGINLKHYGLQPYPENDKVHFLYLGRIMKEKGMDELFVSVKKLQKEYEGQFVLDLVGFFEDEYKEQVDSLTKDGIAVFHGFQEEPRPFYAKADCVVLPSYHEGLSNVLLEAAATGRAVITSDIPGCKETVEHGKSGLLCQVKDTDSLLSQMRCFMKMSQDERKEMGLRGRGFVEERFEKRMVVQMTISAIKKTMGV